jgi:hypothetical protein
VHACECPLSQDIQLSASRRTGSRSVTCHRQV